MLRATLRYLLTILFTGAMRYLSYGTMLSVILFVGISVATANGFQAHDPVLLRFSVQLLFTAAVAVTFVLAIATPTAYRLAKMDGKAKSHITKR